MDNYDVIIIGNGPAGITAAVYAVRAKLKTLVIGNGLGSLEKAEKIENYYGFEQPISGTELVKIGIKQASRLGVVIINDEVLSISKEESFEVSCKDNKYTSKAVILATGKNRTSPNIEGFKKLEGKGISFCAVCDGFFYRNKTVAVLGGGEYAYNEASELSHFTKNLTIFTNGEKPTFENKAGFEIVTDVVVEILGENKIEALKTKDEKSYPIDGLFVALKTAGAADFAKKMGVLLNGDNIVVNEKAMTNVDGLFAAGDCIGGIWQISTAVGEGAKAGLSVVEYVRQAR